MKRTNWEVRAKYTEVNGNYDAETLIATSKKKAIAFYHEAKNNWQNYFDNKEYEEASIELIKRDTEWGDYEEYIVYTIYTEGKKLLEEEHTYAYREMVSQETERKERQRRQRSIIDKCVYSQEEINKITQDLADEYKVGKVEIRYRDMCRTYGNAWCYRNVITYAYELLREERWKILHTIYHEVAHLIAYKRFGDGVNHEYKFQRIETELCEKVDIKPLYARERGYATAFIEISTGKVLKCKFGYEVVDGRLRKKCLTKTS